MLHYYKGYAFDKPEGVTMWNVYKMVTITDVFSKKKVTLPDYGNPTCHCATLKECRITVDCMEA